MIFDKKSYWLWLQNVLDVHVVHVLYRRFSDAPVIPPKPPLLILGICTKLLLISVIIITSTNSIYIFNNSGSALSHPIHNVWPTPFTMTETPHSQLLSHPIHYHWANPFTMIKTPYSQLLSHPIHNEHEWATPFIMTETPHSRWLNYPIHNNWATPFTITEPLHSL
jgi:hypothetical protein